MSVQLHIHAAVQSALLQSVPNKVDGVCIDHLYSINSDVEFSIRIGQKLGASYNRYCFYGNS